MSKSTKPTLAEVRCVECGKVFKNRTPKGGDGSGHFPSYHKSNGKTCIGYKLEGEYVSHFR